MQSSTSSGTIRSTSSGTICAIATARGGAIGIVRISGSEAINIAEKILITKHPLADAKANSIHFATILHLDEVLVSIFRSPHSYTGEDSIEIACHGSSYILQQIVERLLQAGCTLAAPGEYTQRAFLNGKLDLSQAEAVADLIASQNAASHRVALQQMKGSFSHRLAAMREQLLEMTSLLELELDFSEEDVTFADRQQLYDLGKNILSEIQHLSASFAAGNAIKNGIPVAIIGAPNVGKSTLLNQLLQEERAIVTDIEGTTRDIIEDNVTIQGFSFRFIDTAGLRATTDTIESIGIQRSIQAAERAQIILLVTEAGVPYPQISVTPEQTVIKVLNKADKNPDVQGQDEQTYMISALTGQGLEALKEALIAAVPPLPDDALVVTNLRHKQALDKAEEAISRVLEAFNPLPQHPLSTPLDLIAEDLRLCINHLAEITGGAITPDETLQNIFSHFCIGK